MNKIASTFYKGNHAQVAGDASGGSGFLAASGADMPFYVGSLAFLGRLTEAEFLFQKAMRRLTADEAAASRFFLAVAFCRHSEYQKARDYLLANWRLARRGPSPALRFFVAQGVGFYRFFCGRFRDALRHAQAALLAALEADYPYGTFLATDLTGHSLANLGRIAEGLAQLQRALKLARSLGNGGMAEATQIGLACYEAQFGLSGARTVDRLQALHDRLDPQNTYSQATLLLELSRQWTLRGDVGVSRRYLDEACRIIYSLQHRRQSATFNHRHAYNLHLAGDDLPALNLIRLAKSEIHPAVDLVLDLQLSGLQLAICRKLAFPAEIARLERHVGRLTAKTGSYVAGRILARQTGGGAYPFGQDAIGDLLDQRGDGFAGRGELVAAGYYTPLRARLGLAGKERAIVASAALDSIVVIDPPSTVATGVAPSRQLRALLGELSAGERTKEALIGAVWGYKYHPGRHDPLIHQAMARLRDALGERGNWLEFTGKGYRLPPDVRILAAAGPAIAPSTPASPGTLAPPRGDEGGSRGILVLEYLVNHRFVDAKTCMDLFQVSRVTASRDLAALLKKKAIRRHGGGRSTRYELNRAK